MSEQGAGEAIITGASSGIGAALAPGLAAAGYDLVLVARRGDRLEALAETLRGEHPQRAVKVLALDIAAGSALEALQALSPNPEILVNNAGFGLFGSCLAHGPAEQSHMVRVNCEALTTLTIGYLPRMVERGSGIVLNMASIAGFQPVPHFAVYAATKAYVLSLSEALDEELKGTGVRVMACCPGPVPTEFQQRAGSPDARETPKRSLRTADEVAAACLDAIRSPRRTIVPAAFHSVMRWAQRWVPRSTVVSMAGKKMRERRPRD